MKKDSTPQEMIVEILKCSHAASDESWPDKIHVVDAGGGHRISAAIYDDGAALTVVWASDDDEPVVIQFFTSSSIRALREACDQMLSSGPMLEDPRPVPDVVNVSRKAERS